MNHNLLIKAICSICELKCLNTSEDPNWYINIFSWTFYSSRTHRLARIYVPFSYWAHNNFQICLRFWKWTECSLSWFLASLQGHIIRWTVNANIAYKKDLEESYFKFVEFSNCFCGLIFIINKLHTHKIGSWWRYIYMIYIFNARLEEYKTKLEARRTGRTYSQEWAGSRCRTEEDTDINTHKGKQGNKPHERITAKRRHLGSTGKQSWKKKI